MTRSSTLFTFVALASLVAVQGAIVQRSGAVLARSGSPTPGPPISPLEIVVSPHSSTSSDKTTPSSKPPDAPSKSTSFSPHPSTTSGKPTPSSKAPDAPSKPATATGTPPPRFQEVIANLAGSIGVDVKAYKSHRRRQEHSVNCHDAHEWQTHFSYIAGDRVIYDSQYYTATQWSFDNAPPSHPDQWSLTECPHDAYFWHCEHSPAWNENVAYDSGDAVTYQGSLWGASQWTKSNPPGDTSGSWALIGTCGS